MKYCHECGAELIPEGKFCASCGFKITYQSSSTPQDDPMKLSCAHKDLFLGHTSSGMLMCKDCLETLEPTEKLVTSSDTTYAYPRGNCTHKNFYPVANSQGERKCKDCGRYISKSNLGSIDKGIKIEKVFLAFLGFALVVIIFSFAAGNSDQYNETSSQNSQQTSERVPITQQLSQGDGPKDTFLEQPLSGAIDVNTLSIAGMSGNNPLSGCSSAYTVREGADCIYAYFMNAIGSNDQITVADVKQQLTPGFTMPYILHQLFPSQVYFNSVLKQIVWLAGQDEKNGVTFSQY